MKSKKGAGCPAFSDSFYGSATVGERGQIVIPSEARAELGFQPGDKVLIMRHPIYQGIMICKFEAVRDFLDEFTEHVTRLEAMKEEREEESE